MESDDEVGIKHSHLNNAYLLSLEKVYVRAFWNQIFRQGFLHRNCTTPYKYGSETFRAKKPWIISVLFPLLLLLFNLEE